MDTPKEFLDVVRKTYPKAERIYLSAYRDKKCEDVITKSTLMDLDGDIVKFTWLNTCFTRFPKERGTEKCLQEMFGEDMVISMPLLSYLYKHGVGRISILVEGGGRELAKKSGYGLSEFGFHYEGITPKERNGII
tara:strand:- start:3024 stop:3428 length:405 start_codon:yes stop_codon:yes gene_type:complete